MLFELFPDMLGMFDALSWLSDVFFSLHQLFDLLIN